MLLTLSHISKSFGWNRVLNDVTVHLEQGRILGLIGENGAGKSTLMNILGGVLSPDEGQVILDGSPVELKTPSDAIRNGIAFIHQELNLIPDLPVYENLFIGREKHKHGLLDSAGMRKDAEHVFQQMGIQIDTNALVRDLDASYRQIVEIARALMMNARLIIMDEPTTSLTQREIAFVFSLMRTLAKQGVAIIFISHKLKEILSVCDSYAVLRDGKLVSSSPVTKEVTPKDLAAMMVGHTINANAHAADRPLGPVLLQVSHLSSAGLYSDVSFSLHAGEILGFTGLLGDGRSDIFRTIFGCQKADAGTISMKNAWIHPASPSQASKLGIAYLSGNRKEYGILKDMSVLDNGTFGTLKDYVQGLTIRKKRQTDAFLGQKKRLNIKTGALSDLITTLSGGNQQKVMLSKWLLKQPAVMVFDNPTQGVDVGAKEDIYSMLEELASHGIGIVILSGESAEIIRLCKKVHVLFHGVIQGTLEGSDITEQNIMYYATGNQ